MAVCTTRRFKRSLRSSRGRIHPMLETLRPLLAWFACAIPGIFLLMSLKQRREGIDLTGLGGVLDEIKH
jgi:hypothetical protein